MNIAICDDEKVFLKQLHTKINSLKIHNCQISEFTSGQELLSNFVKGMYEIVILDVEMPGLNGLETAERIRQTDKSVIISFLTNYSEFAVKGYEVGAFRYILKNQPDYAYMEQLLSVFDEYNTLTVRFQPSYRKYAVFWRFQRSSYRFGQHSVNFYDTSRYSKIGFLHLVVSSHTASRFGIFGIAFVTASQQCRSFFLSV